MFRLFLATAAWLWAGCAFAADQPQFAPPPSWVKVAAAPDTAAKPGGMAVQVLLSDRQTRFGPNGDEFYSETAFRILTPAGLSVASAIEPSWNPETETLTIHKLNVLRAGAVIDLLDGGKKVTVLRREKNLELAMLDGDLTASIQPEGLQVGDILDMAYTLTRRDPVMRGHSQGFEVLPPFGVASRVRVRVLWPSSKAVQWRETDGAPPAKITHSAEETELVAEATDYSAPKPPSGAPDKFGDLAQLEFSDFHGWADVSALLAPLYAKAEVLSATSPIRLEAQKIRAASADPKTRAAAALRLVQDQVRYTFIGMNLGGYTPADADLTWSRRFGDCKGKTVLLVALLRELGIEAEPVLVSTGLGDGLDQRRPMLFFDHVIARAHIGAKDYWLDGTRSGDRNLDDIAVPDFHWVLPVRNAGAQLVKLTPAAFERPAFERVLRLDASAGLDAPASAHVESLFRGDNAVEWNLSLSAAGRADAERSLRDYWRERLPWIVIKKVDFAFDDANREMRFTMDGAAAMAWARNSGVRDFQIADSSLGFEPSFNRDPGPHDDAPFSVPFPSYEKWTVIITLPDKGSGFGLLDAGDVDQSVAGRRYQRTTRIKDGVVTMVATEQALVPEFPASEAPAAATTLRQLYAYDVTVRGGAPEQIVTDTGDDEPAPTDATGFDARATGFLGKHDFNHAIKDFDQAVQLDPKSSKYLYNRGVAHFENHQDDLALSDFNQALRLRPDDTLALQARADLYLFRGDEKRAQQDFDEAIRVAPTDSKIPVREADAFERAGRYDAAIHVFDQLIAKGPTAWLYNARCWSRAESGRDLLAGLADCDAALKLQPGAAYILDSRGFVELRLGRFDEAIKDYDGALKAQPNQSPSLYARGIAKIRKGDRQGGAADVAAARARWSGVDSIFARLGVAP